jgi:hypothetical protein
MAISKGPCSPPLILPVIASEITSGEAGDISLRGLFVESAGTPCGGGIFVGSTRWRPDTRKQDVLVTGACSGTLRLARESSPALVALPISFTLQGALMCGCCGALPVNMRFPPLS